MRFPRFPLLILSCLLAALTSVLVFAQSNPPALVNEPSALSNAQTPAARMGVQPATKAPVSFAKAVSYSSGGESPYGVAIADLNGDGYPDLVVSNICQSGSNCDGEVSVLLGNGDGTFQAPVSYSSGGFRTYGVAVADLTGGGTLDLVVTSWCQSSSDCFTASGIGVVSVLMGNGNGTFQSPVVYTSGGYAAQGVAIGDVNGDGIPDLVVVNECTNATESGECTPNGEVSVLLGNGNGTFQAPVTYSSGGRSGTSVALADLNGDGYLDIVVLNLCQSPTSCDGTIGVLLNNGDGTFQAPVTYDSGGNVGTSLAIGDVNGDGHPDLVTTNQCQTFPCLNNTPGAVDVLIGNGDGTFQSAVNYDSGGYLAESVALGDVNGNGQLDLVVANLCEKPLGDNFVCKVTGSVDVLLGNGKGTFQPAVGYGSGGDGAIAVAVGDVNGDGRPDLVVANEGSNTVDVLLNNFTATTKTAVSSSPNPSLVNQSVTFAATVTSESSVPNGATITFYNGSTELGTGATTDGIASLTTSFSKAKTYTVKASYPGDVFHKKSSGTVKQTVNQ